MRFFLPCAVLFFLTAVGSLAVESGAEGPVIAGRVREIFEAKCLDCHGPQLRRPKGKFGYVLDLQRVASNPEFVERGSPKNSEIYKLVLNDEMPGEDADVPPLTGEEKDIVKRWIELGAPAAPASAADPLPVAVEGSRAPMPLWKKSLRWIGQFHRFSTHFPVALMLVAVFAESLAWWTRRDSWMQTVRFLVVLAAIGGVAATALGWIEASFSSYNKAPGALLWWHRWVGTGTAVWAAVCAALLLLDECREGTKPRQCFRGALLLGAVLVSITGFLGSALIYGLDHYGWK